MARGTVWVHYSSHEQRFNRADCWGPLHSAASRDSSTVAEAQNQERSRSTVVAESIGSSISTQIDWSMMKAESEAVGRLREVSPVMALFVALLWFAVALNSSVALACFMFL